MKEQIPRIVLTTAEVKAMPIEYTEGRRSVASSYGGICYLDARTIFINARKLKTANELRQIILNELVHYRFNYLSHGKQFEQRIELIQTGKRYPIKNIQVKSLDMIRKDRQIREQELEITSRLQGLELEASQKEEISSLETNEFIRDFNECVARQVR
jgi:hypothetical protein